jgi:hypothetical protein
METLKIPKFENETDEANWLYENREGWRRLPAGGAGGPSAAGHAERNAASRPRPPFASPRRTSPAPGPWPIAAGLRYQTYLKMLIHEALEREERLAS